MAFDREDFISAGKLYRILLDNYPDFKPFAHLLSFNIETLNSRITDCSLTLFKGALEKYRKGNLADAISIWEQILSYDPENLEVKRAIDTANTQLKSLKEKK